jgi:hypothetical protein
MFPGWLWFLASALLIFGFSMDRYRQLSWRASVLIGSKWTYRLDL